MNFLSSFTFSKLYDFLPSTEQKRRDLEIIGKLLFLETIFIPTIFQCMEKTPLHSFGMKVCDGE